MSGKLFFELISPEKQIISIEVDSITAVGHDGEFELLPGHSPFFTLLKPSVLSYNVDNETYYAAIMNGFLKVSDNKVVVLTENAVPAADIDIQETMKLKSEIEIFMKHYKENGDTAALTKSNIELAYQNAKIEISNKLMKV